jgi:hypothetical protein
MASSVLAASTTLSDRDAFAGQVPAVALCHLARPTYLLEAAARDTPMTSDSAFRPLGISVMHIAAPPTSFAWCTFLF